MFKQVLLTLLTLVAVVVVTPFAVVWSMAGLWTLLGWEIGPQFPFDGNDGCFVIVFHLLGWLIAAPLAARYVWTHSRPQLNPSVCSACGYDLRVTPGPTCPECGAPRLPAAHGQKQINAPSTGRTGRGQSAT